MGVNSTYFVYIGSVLPKYARSSIKMAHRMSGMRPHLIANASTRPSVKEQFCDFTAIEDFYDHSLLEEAKKKITNDLLFRDSFWLKTLERFFVLSQFAKQKQLNSLFHSELDQILFGVDSLVKNIDLSEKKGVFVPFHKPELAVASVFYINDFEALDSLLSEATCGDFFASEMALIARWASRNPDRVFSLPTLASALLGKGVATPCGVCELSVQEQCGVVDAAQLGSWIFGIDPRNVPINKKPQTKFADSPDESLLSKQLLEGLSFELSEDQKKLYVITHENYKIRLYNLHLHAKLHEYILAKNKLEFFLMSVKKPDQICINYARQIQIKHHAKRFFVSLVNDPGKFLKALFRRTFISLINRKS